MAGYITYWSKEHVRNLKKAGDDGALSVIFGSRHTMMPSISKVKKGDVIYPVTLAEGTLCVLAKLPVEKIEIAFEYLIRETGLIYSALVPDGYAVEHERAPEIGGVFYSTSNGIVDCKADLSDGLQLLIEKDMQEKPHKFHQQPQTCCASLAASGTYGSKIAIRPLPIELIPQLRFGPTKSKQKALRLNKDGVPTVVSLSGFVRRMSEETQEIFESMF